MVCEVPKNFGSAGELERIMSDVPQMRYDHRVHVVDRETYLSLAPGALFACGALVEGCGGMNEDRLVVTAHSAQDLDAKGAQHDRGCRDTHGD